MNRVVDLDERDAAAWIEQARSGDFAAAWRLSDRIRARSNGRRDWTRPRHVQEVWDGTPLDGRRTLIHCYHGLGDTIQFVRYASLVRRTAREVILWAQPALIPLLAGAAGIDRLLPLHDGDPGVDRDVDVEIMELPYVFRTTLATVPAAVPYLRVEPAQPPDHQRPCVGIAWRGGDWNPARAIPFHLLAPLFERRSVRWVSLQDVPGPDEHHPSLATPDVSTVLATARVAQAMDLVITIDTMTAHLAGALAMPVWTLLTADADWRWLLGRADSPWYPTMRLFRQETEGDWRAVVEDVCGALDALF